MQSLILLDISETSASDKALECISNMHSLRDLDFRQTKVTDLGLKHLEVMSSLDHIAANNNVSEEALLGLGECLHLLYTPRGSKDLSR
jgi:hypothetical protein